MKQRENEKNAIDSFIEILRRVKGVEYTIDDRPENKYRNTPAVEVILAPKDKGSQLPKIAVEHTIVEAHEKQILYAKELDIIEEKINRNCVGKLPTNRCFQLIVPPALVTNKDKKSINQFIQDVSNWLPNEAKNLTEEKQSYSKMHNEHEVVLECHNSVSELNGTIGIMSTSPKEAYKKKLHRFHRAIDEKLSKLINYKNEGYSTALLLEDVSYRYALPKEHWKDLIPEKYHPEFQFKIDYVALFVSNEKKMIVGTLWKEESRIYDEIPENRRFSFLR